MNKLIEEEGSKLKLDFESQMKNNDDDLDKRKEFIRQKIGEA